MWVAWLCGCTRPRSRPARNGPTRPQELSSRRGRGRVVCAALQVPLDKGERDQCENSSLARCPPRGCFMVLFCQPNLAGRTKPPSGGASIRPRPVRQNLCGSLQVSPSRSRSPRPRPGALVVCGIGVRVRVPFTRSPFARRAKNGPRGEFYR